MTGEKTRESRIPTFSTNMQLNAMNIALFQSSFERFIHRSSRIHHTQLILWRAPKFMDLVWILDIRSKQYLDAGR